MNQVRLTLSCITTITKFIYIFLSKTKNTTYLFFPIDLVSYDVENGVAMTKTTAVLHKTSSRHPSTKVLPVRFVKGY